MKLNNVYSKKTLRIFKFFILIAIVILAISNVRRLMLLLSGNCQNYSYEIFTFIANIITIGFFFILIFFPHKFEFCALAAFFYSSIVFIFEPKNMMGIMLYYLALSFLYARGFFLEKRKQKNIIATIVLFILVLPELRFGLKVFIDSIIEKVAISFIYFVSTYFIYSSLMDTPDESQGELILNVDAFQNLTHRDAEWLVEILNGSKYEKIAIESQMSLGSVKNRTKIIFAELNVGDRRGFLNRYSKYKISFENQIIE